MGKLKDFFFHLATHQKSWYGRWHVYLGVTAGFVIAIVGLTGSILVFQEEIDRALNPEFYDILAREERLPIDMIIPIVESKYPDIKARNIFLPNERPGTPYVLFDLETGEETFINPYTGELTGKRMHESSLMHVVEEIHRSLYIPVVGRYIVGICTLVLIILTISGLRLWIPKKWKKLKAALTVKFSASLKRQNYDWHNILGFYSSPVIILLAVTGFAITFSMVVVPLLFFLSFQPPKNIGQLMGGKSAYTANARQLTPAEILDIVEKEVPEATVRFFAFPKDSTASFRVDVASPGTVRSGKRDLMMIDQYTGDFVFNSRRDLPNIGQAYLSWLTPIHYGSFGGLATRILACIASLIPTVLFITGLIIWWSRFKKKASRRNKKSLDGALHRRHKVKEPEIA